MSDTLNQDQEAPKILFPCEYPVKVMGDAGEEFHTFVCSIFEEHAPGFDRARITVRDSSTGNFQALTITITATGEDQLRAIFSSLRGDSRVKMVL